MNKISSEDHKRVARAEHLYEQTICAHVNNKDLSDVGIYRSNRLITQTQDRLEWLIRDCESQAAKNSISAYVDKLELLIAYD